MSEELDRILLLERENKDLREIRDNLDSAVDTLARDNAELTAKLQQVTLRLADVLLSQTEEEVQPGKGTL